ncbi:uncharacterized protein TNCV_1312321 [Trichonephila clavipes]|nr:uncharacterized protein TNCV_1312321 [Trichonephila clavipes]
MDEEANFPIAASILQKNLYMDDVLCGAATLEDPIVIRQQLKGILNSAGMELHKLCANHEKLSPDPEQNYNFATLTETKTLGVSWKPNLDCFLIKRYQGVLVAFPELIEIHGFADASERCCSAAVYCKSKNLKSETLLRLITSKSRVAPIKSLTIPRLELCAAVLLAKLVKRVVAALQLETAELYLWSDSMIVLAWLRKEPMDLKTFVQNRVAKIQELYPNQLWRHVLSDQNPADLVSRGVDPDKLLQQNLWFNGPTFLSDDDYPNRTVNCREKLDEYNSELKNCVNEQIENFQSVLNIHVNDFSNDLLNLSNNYITILRVLSFIFRFMENLKGINRVAGPLTAKEFEKAETFLVKKVQEQEFSSDMEHLKSKGSVLPNIRNPDEKLANYLAAEGIEWKFIPARSPNFGGLWEAAIKSCKYHLKRVVNGINLSKLTVWCALWAGGIIGPYFFKNDEGHNVTVNGDRYRAMITNFFIPELNNHDVQELWFQQDSATCHTARATIDLLKDTFGDRLISRFGSVNWPPRSCDLTALDYFLWGYVKSLVYADKPQTLDHLEDNIRRVIADIRPQMLEKVIENWTSILDYIQASRGSPMPEIIFKI